MVSILPNILKSYEKFIFNKCLSNIIISSRTFSRGLKRVIMLKTEKMEISFNSTEII